MSYPNKVHIVGAGEYEIWEQKPEYNGHPTYRPITPPGVVSFLVLRFDNPDTQDDVAEYPEWDDGGERWRIMFIPFNASVYAFGAADSIYGTYTTETGTATVTEYIAQGGFSLTADMLDALGLSEED